MNEMGDTFKLNVLDEAKHKNKKVLLFWYPKDFTFVCPTELHAFQAALEEFEKRNTVVIGASCDTPEVHFAWLNTPKDNGGIEGDNVTYRATYLIDEEGQVFHEGVNHMPLGRNVNEFLRLIDAYTHVQEKGEVCPANWEEGKEGMNANREGVASYLASN